MTHRDTDTADREAQSATGGFVGDLKIVARLGLSRPGQVALRHEPHAAAMPRSCGSQCNISN